MEKSTNLARDNIVYPGFALYWARELGAKVDSLTALHGGINNQVFSCDTDAKKSTRFVIKGYAPKLGHTDRMRAEVEFLRYAELVAPSYVPKLIAVDDEHRCVVLEYLDGSPYPLGVISSEEDVIQASNFFRLLNSDKLLAKEYVHQSAAEGYLSLKEHLENVRERINLLDTKHLPSEMCTKATLLVQKIRSQFDEVSMNTVMLIENGRIQDLIGVEACCISPSDFGFHNAFLCAGRVKFFDFEFSGWDDPAKVIIDFILQPRIPVTSKLAGQFYKTVIECSDKQFEARSNVLGPILRLKWLCIMLSVLRLDRLRQMEIATQEQLSPNFIGKRLEDVQAYIHKEFSFGLH